MPLLKISIDPLEEKPSIVRKRTGNSREKKWLAIVRTELRQELWGRGEWVGMKIKCKGRGMLHHFDVDLFLVFYNLRRKTFLFLELDKRDPRCI